MPDPATASQRRGRGARYFDPPCCNRMKKTQQCTVQKIAAVARESAAVFGGDASCRIERVPDERMPGGGKVDAYLVWPPGCDPDLKQGRSAAPLENTDMAVGRLSSFVRRIDRPQNRVRNRTYRSVDFEFVAGRAPGSQGTIHFQNSSVAPCL